MHPLRSIRRLALGAAVAGAAIGAVPALASAASTCSYYRHHGRQHQGRQRAASRCSIVRSGAFITVRDGAGGPADLLRRRQQRSANVQNTDRINVFGPITHSTDGYIIDESVDRLGPAATIEPTGSSEIEVTAFTTGRRARQTGSARLVAARHLSGRQQAAFVDFGRRRRRRLLHHRPRDRDQAGRGRRRRHPLGPEHRQRRSASVRLDPRRRPRATTSCGAVPRRDTFFGGAGNDTLLTIDRQVRLHVRRPRLRQGRRGHGSSTSSPTASRTSSSSPRSGACASRPRSSRPRPARPRG